MLKKATIALGAGFLALLVVIAGTPVGGLRAGEKPAPDPGISFGRRGDGITGVTVTSKPYLIMRNGANLDIGVSWDSVGDGPVKVVQSSIANALSGPVVEFQSPPICNQLGTWSSSNWVCLSQESSGFSVPFVAFRTVPSFESDLQWTSLFVEINNPDLLDEPGTLGARSSVTVPVAINSALVVTPGLQSDQILSELQLNEEAFVVVDSRDPINVNLNLIDITFSPGVQFSFAGGPAPGQCQPITNPPNTLRCNVHSSVPLAKPIYVQIIPATTAPVTVSARFYQSTSGGWNEYTNYYREITLPVIDPNATPTPVPTPVPDAFASYIPAVFGYTPGQPFRGD